MNSLIVVDVQEIINKVIAIPPSPGVYAWFRKLSLDTTTDANFVSSIREILSAKTWPKTLNGSGKIGPYSAQLSLQPSRRDLSTSKETIAKDISLNSKQRDQFSDLLLQVSVFQPPLYVGKAINLQVRIASHIRGSSGFAKNVFSTIAPSQMVLAYIELTGLPHRAPELLEGIVGSAALARYAGRIG